MGYMDNFRLSLFDLFFFIIIIFFALYGANRSNMLSFSQISLVHARVNLRSRW